MYKCNWKKKFKKSVYDFIKIYRSARESYGDSAIGYVSLNNQCIVEAITPEHKVRGRYFTSVTIDEEQNIIKDVSSSDCAASEGKFTKLMCLNIIIIFF